MWNILFCKSITPNYAIEYQSCIWCYIQLLPVVQNIFCVLEVPVKWLTTRDVVQVTIQTLSSQSGCNNWKN